MTIWVLSNLVGGAGTPEATEVARAAAQPATTIAGVVPEPTEAVEPATATDSPAPPPTDTRTPSPTITRTPLPTNAVTPTATNTPTSHPTATFTNTPLPSPTLIITFANPTAAAAQVSDLNADYAANDCAARVLNRVTFSAVSGSDNSLVLSWSEQCQLPENYFFRVIAQCRSIPSFRTIDCQGGGDTTAHQMILTLPYQDPANTEITLWILIRLITPTGSEAATQMGTKLGTDWVYFTFEELVSKTQE